MDLQELRWGAAVHEAGHVVAAWAAGYEVGSVEIDASGLGEVRCRVHRDVWSTSAERALQLSFAMAGVLAELLVLGREDEGYDLLDLDRLTEIAYEETWDPGAIEAYEAWLEIAERELEASFPETDFDCGAFESDGAQIARVFVAELQDPDGVRDVQDLARRVLGKTLDLLREQRVELDRLTAEILSAEETIYFDREDTYPLAS